MTAIAAVNFARILSVFFGSSVCLPEILLGEITHFQTCKIQWLLGDLFRLFMGRYFAVKLSQKLLHGKSPNQTVRGGVNFFLGLL